MKEDQKSILELFQELRELEALRHEADKDCVAAAEMRKRDEALARITDDCAAVEAALCRARPKRLAEAACQAEILATMLDSARDLEPATGHAADQAYELSLNILLGVADMAGHHIQGALRPVRIERGHGA